MADRRQYPPRKPSTPTASHFLQKLREHAPHSPKLTGLATLVISGGILLLINGLTLTAAVLGIVFLTPLIIISSPIWIPIGLMLCIAVAGFLSFSGCVVAVVFGMRWMYRRFMKATNYTSDQPPAGNPDFADGDEILHRYGRMIRPVKDAAPGA